MKLATIVEVYPKAPFSIATTPGIGEGSTPFPGLLHFTLDTYLIMPSINQGGIKYHFLSLWYDLTWNWTPVPWVIDKHFTYLSNGLEDNFCFVLLIYKVYWMVVKCKNEPSVVRKKNDERQTILKNHIS